MKNLLSIFFLILSTYANTQSKPIDSLKFINQNRIKNDLIKITQTQKSRNYQNIETLNTIADYIKSELIKVSDSVAFQPYLVNDKTYKNVIGSIGIENNERIIIGAHYDVYGNQQGADDNASGVTGLLELARLLSKEKLNYRIDFVAYTLEEPPFFRTQQMGSYIHANYLHINNIAVKGMICLEMIGYYNDIKGSQSYPIPEMNLKYGNTADFITVVQNEKSDRFGNQIGLLMKEQDLIKTILFKGSHLVRGIDYSDHLNYWNFNYPAVMVTNTSFYRNKNYHTKNDTIETLDLNKMSAVIEQLYIAIKQLK
ncbi:M28 family peptidase [Flavivirga algicola]|uniref:M28 family peptidase n=1 Tax=Flavivirga algicola TaxID=2729136 RepID=A0ABX1RRQ6_9FLAO|nr:M28 family peptidase [Flavivirga algicola]NMH86231.1 M28 family peptidase [Flavivirga algicola]